MNQLPLLAEPEVPSLSSYSPKYTREQCLFSYQCKSLQVGGGFKDFSFDPDNIQYVDEHSVVVLGHTIVGAKRYYSGRALHTVIAIVNEFMGNKDNKKNHSDIFDYINEHAADLSCSVRYWLAVERQADIDKKQKDIDLLQHAITQQRILAKIDAIEVHRERSLSSDERDLLKAELGYNTEGLYL